MKINFLGDIGIFKKYQELNIDPFFEIQLPESDLNIGNFEFIIQKNRKKIFYDVQEKYSCSYDYLSKLKINKFHGFGLANNHSLDYGLEGALDTIDYIENAGIQVFGFSKNMNYSIGKFEVDGIKVGVIACVKKGRWSKELYGYGPDSYDNELIKELIFKNITNFDHIIVYPHWGTELISVPDVKDTLNAKKFIDAGASAVIGHHPHVSQGVEQYKNGIIAYSLGSFIYVHEDELGYSKRDTKRHVSICLNIEFNKSCITDYTCYYYRYNQNNKIPEKDDSESIKNFIYYLNDNIYNQNLYKQEIKRILVLRELFSFWERFKASPMKTIVNYSKHILSVGMRRFFNK